MLNRNRVARIYRRLALVANAVSLSGVRVLFNQEASKTDGRTIYIGRCPEQSVEGFLETATAYILHEAAHVWLTDFYTRGRFEGQPRLLHKLANAIEDARIEARLTNELPGAKSYLDRLVRACVADGSFPALRAADPEWAVCGYVLYRLRDSWCGNPLVGGLADAGRGAVTALIGREGAAKLDGLLPEKPLRDTNQTINLAEEILALLEQARASQEGGTQGQDQNPKGGDGQKQGNGEGERGVGSSQGSTNAKQATGKADESNEAPGGGQDKAGTDSAGADEGQQGEPGQADANEPRALADKFKELLVDYAPDEDAAPAGDFGARLRENLNAISDHTQGQDQALIPDLPDTTRVVIVNNRRGGADEIPVVGGAGSRLRAQLRVALIDRARTRIMTASTGARLHNRRLARVGVGDPRIMRQRQVGSDPNAAVVLLVDCSASMEGERLDLAMVSALALASALEGLRGVDFAVLGYATGSADRKAVIYRVKSFGERLTPARGRFVAPDYLGMTPTGEALLEANRLLGLSMRRKRLGIVLTDGKSNGWVPETKAFIQGAGMGINYRCLGIGIDLPESYPNSATLRGLDELPAAIMESAQTVLAA